MPYSKRDVSGSVVLYNSGVHMTKNVMSYLMQIDHLYVIDNSERVNHDLVKILNRLPNVTYSANEGNMGVAYALNKAANMAIKAGYKFLLTMDDDTSLPDGAIQIMLSYVNKHDPKELGIIAGQSVTHLVEDTIKAVPYTITSGNLLNLSAYQDCGPFMNELFIDFVDHEYCFRLAKKKYKVIEINNIHLTHKLGEKKRLKFLDYKLPIYWTSHNPLRIYYKTRNCFFVLKEYKYIEISIRLFFYKEIFKDFLKIILLENKKKSRFVLFLKGLRDGFRGDLGKKVILT